MGCCAAKDSSLDKSSSEHDLRKASQAASSIPLHSDASPSPKSASKALLENDVHTKSNGADIRTSSPPLTNSSWTVIVNEQLTRSLLFKASKSASYERTTLRLRSPSEILPGFLYLGNQKDAANFLTLKKHCIGLVINLAGKEVNFTEDQLALMKDANVQLETFAIDDVESADIAKFFKPVIALIESSRLSRRVVLVHCQLGVSRSATLVIAYLLTHCQADSNGLLPSLQKCYEHVEYLRPIICPNYGFLKALMAYEKTLRGIPESTLSVSGIGQNSGKINAAIDEATRKAVVELAEEEDLSRRKREQEEEEHRQHNQKETDNQHRQSQHFQQYPPPLHHERSLEAVSSSSSSSAASDDVQLQIDGVDNGLTAEMLSATAPSSSGSHPLTRESNAQFDSSILSSNTLLTRSNSTISPKSTSRETQDGRRKTEAITSAQMQLNLAR